MKHLHSRDILTDNQHEFRKLRSCESQLIITIDDLANALNDKEQVDVFLLDFVKALDKVSYQRLLQKVEKCGVRGNILEWITSFLQNRTQQVVLDGQPSAHTSVLYGVRQGTVLGPLLFLIYINDLPSNVKSTASLFADDTVVYRKVQTEADADILQDDLHDLEKWANTWLMEFNVDKCQLLRVTNKWKPIQGNYPLDGKQLPVVDDAKYLGVTVDRKLLWNEHINSMCRKANGAIAFLRRNMSGCTSEVKSWSYQSMVRSNMEYASTVWDPHTEKSIHQLEMVQ